MQISQPSILAAFGSSIATFNLDGLPLLAIEYTPNVQSKGDYVTIMPTKTFDHSILRSQPPVQIEISETETISIPLIQALTFALPDEVGVMAYGNLHSITAFHLDPLRFSPVPFLMNEHLETFFEEFGCGWWTVKADMVVRVREALASYQLEGVSDAA